MSRADDVQTTRTSPECGNQAGETCPACWSAVLRPEGAHGRCDACGWIGKCCE